MVAVRSIVGFFVFATLFIAGVWVVFDRYHEQIYALWQSGPEEYHVFFNEIGLRVTVADDEASRQQGLSGTTSLGELEGKLFIFDESGYYGFWMRDMNYPIDIIWLDEDLHVVHIEANVAPDSYPRTFKNDVPARFVLEVNANFASSFNITEGSVLSVPATLLPADVQIR